MTPTDRSGTPAAAGEAHANPGYALGQLARALRTSQSHDDPDTRKRAEKKAADWVRIFEGMLSGHLQVGSRTPLAGVPGWATLEVAKGGFATGELLAGGPLRPHEQERLSRLTAVSAGNERAALNASYLTDAGLQELAGLLASQCYHVSVPEEGALLVVAWLLQHGDGEAARSVLDAIAPFFSRLRFYPIPQTVPAATSPVVHLQTVGQVVESLSAVRDSSHVLALRESVTVWAPMADRVLELFAETVEGSMPSIRLGEEGRPVRTPSGAVVVEGGWPCQRFPEGWHARAAAFLDDFRRLRGDHRLCGKPDSRKDSFGRLRRYLETCVRDPQRLTGRDVGMIRVILAGIVTARGLPGSPRHQEIRDRQARQAAAPTRTAIARLLVARLAGLPQGGGLDSLEAITGPVTALEAAERGLTAGQLLPAHRTRALLRCLSAPAHTLVELGVITSAEALARIVPQISSQVLASGIADPQLRRLYEAIYSAFRERRSLLLLNLKSQVKLTELPWVRAVDAHRQNGTASKERSRQTLEHVATLAMTAFPQQILPNKLLQEVRALAEGAGLKIPIVDELAADIFMGTFSDKFLAASKTAAGLLKGTLYERYYAIAFDSVLEMNDVKPSSYGTPTSAAFARLCAQRAGDATGSRSAVAQNGKVIEQEQILTTHNLAVLFDTLGLTETLRSRLRELAEGCFTWVCGRLQQKTAPWQSRLRAVKNAAYAWRQMVFFLSWLPAEEVTDFVDWASTHLAQQRPDFPGRFRPALEGLLRAAKGLDPEFADDRGGTHTGRRFLGWTTGPHWLLQKQD